MHPTTTCSTVIISTVTIIIGGGGGMGHQSCLSVLENKILETLPDYIDIFITIQVMTNVKST